MAENPQKNIFELFLCVSCNSIKEQSFILDCFHVICQDCIPNFNHNPNACCTLPTNLDTLTVHPLNDQYAQQLQRLYEALLPERDKNTCVICPNEQVEDRDILFCVNCASFWCLQHLEIHHRAMINGNQHPFIMLDKDLEIKDVLKEVDEDNLASKAKQEYYTQLNSFIHECEGLIKEGKEHQQILTKLNSTIDRWKITVNEDLDNRFIKIRDKLTELENEAKEDVEVTCHEAKEKLEACHIENETKLSITMRAIEMMQNIRSFCPQKANAVFKSMTFEKVKENSSTSFVTFLLEMTPRIIKINRELEKESNKILIDARIIEPNHTELEFRPNKQLYEGYELEILIQTCDEDDVMAFSTNTMLSIKIDKLIPRVGSIPYAQERIGKEKYLKSHSSYQYVIDGLEAGVYQVEVMVNNRKVDKNWRFSVSRDISCINNPTTHALNGKGEVTGIAVQGNLLYVATGARGEIEMYIINQGCISKEKSNSSEGCSPPIEESVERFLSPRFDQSTSPKRVPYGSGSHQPNTHSPKFGISFELNIGMGVLSGPHGICCYEDYIYVSDKVAHTVFCFTNIGAFIQKFGKRGSEIGEFSSPHGITVNKARLQLVVADRFNHRIQLVDLSTGSTIAYGFSEHYVLEQPVDVAMTNEDFYIVSTARGDILLYDNNFQWIKCLINEFQFPMYITIDQTNQVYISSYSDHKIYTIIPLPQDVFNIKYVEMRESKNPTGVAAGSDGTIYAVGHYGKENHIKPILHGW